MRQIVRNRILTRGNNRCVKCERTEELEIDHIIPLSRGGKEDEDNMQVLCAKCNREKSNGIDFGDFFIIGEHPDYISVERDTPLGAWSDKEFKKLFILMFKENDKRFGIEREYIEPIY